jgi:hypothetical protein
VFINESQKCELLKGIFASYCHATAPPVPCRRPQIHSVREAVDVAYSRAVTGQNQPTMNLKVAKALGIQGLVESAYVKLFGRRLHLGRATRTGPASEKLQRTKPCWGDANFAHNHERNCTASGDEPQTDFQSYRSRESMQLRRSGTNIALNGDSTLCALNDSNDLIDAVKRPLGQLIRELAPASAFSRI